MKLQLGKYYITRSGKRAFISSINLPNPFQFANNDTGKTIKKHSELFPHDPSDPTSKDLPKLTVELESRPIAYGYIAGKDKQEFLQVWSMNGRRFNSIESKDDIVGEDNG